MPANVPPDDIEPPESDSALEKALVEYNATGDRTLLMAELQRMADGGKTFKEEDPSLMFSATQKVMLSACQKADAVVLGFLLEHGAAATYSNQLPIKLVLLVTGRKLEKIQPDVLGCVKLLVAHGADPGGSNGSNLKSAVDSRYDDTVRYFLEQGVSAEKSFGDGYHPLVIAAQFGFTDLVDKTAKEKKTDVLYFSMALEAAAEHGQRETVRQILGYGFSHRQGKDFDLAFSAAVGGQLEFLKELIGQGFTTDFAAPGLLHGVIEGNHGSVLDFLLDNGASFPEAHRFHVDLSNNEGHPLPAVHATLQAWTHRRMTYITDLREKIETLEDLRKTDPDHMDRPVTRLVQLVQRHGLKQIVTIARRAKEDRLTVEDLLATDGYDNTALEILGAKEKLAELFIPELWANRPEDLQALYLATPPVYRGQIACQSMLAEGRRRRLKAHTPPPIRFK